MRQRVAIAQSLIMKPKILLMDEPFGALDPSTRQSMQLFLLELWEDLGMTIFFVTHDLHEAVFLGTRIIVLSHQYIDDRDEYRQVKRGAKIIADHPLSITAKSVDTKKTAEFGELIEEIRLEIDARHKKHVRDFNLKHPLSWRTLRKEELRLNGTTKDDS
jgi:NitT/TauT family transport system ATP-binding protein